MSAHGSRRSPPSWDRAPRGRLRPGDERRDGHRARHRHDLPRRPPAGEGGDGRGCHGRGAGRRRRPLAALGCRRPLRDLRRCTRCARSRDRRNLHTPPAVGARDAEPPALDPGELYGWSCRLPRAVRPARGDRSARGRLALPRVQGAYGETLVTGFAHIEGVPVGILANNGVFLLRVGAEGRDFIELCGKRRVPLVFLQNSPASWSAPNTRRAGSRATAQNRDGGRERAGAEVHRRGRRLVWCRQLRDVRPCVLAALALDVAECGFRRDGRRAGGDRARDGGRGRRGRDPHEVRGGGQPLLLDRTAVGRRNYRPARQAPRARSRLAAALNASIPETIFGIFRM